MQKVQKCSRCRFADSDLDREMTRIPTPNDTAGCLAQVHLSSDTLPVFFELSFVAIYLCSFAREAMSSGVPTNTTSAITVRERAAASKQPFALHRRFHE
jgi:hypothetical protein